MFNSFKLYMDIFQTKISHGENYNYKSLLHLLHHLHICHNSHLYTFYIHHCIFKTTITNTTLSPCTLVSLLLHMFSVSHNALLHTSIDPFQHKIIFNVHIKINIYSTLISIFTMIQLILTNKFHIRKT